MPGSRNPGASARWLGLPSEQALIGHGVSSCATCDGFFFSGKDIAVIGGGDSAMEEALFLTRFATKVSVIHRREQFRSSKIMLERAMAHDKIKFLTNTAVEEVLGVENKLHPDGLWIRGGDGFTQGTVDSHGDHRIAMSFAVASLRAKGKIEILDVANVATSFPGFVELSRSVGLHIQTV